MKKVSMYISLVVLFIIFYFVPQQTQAQSITAIKTTTAEVTVLRDDLETAQITLSKNAIVTVFEEQDGWAKIGYKTIVGYVPTTTLKTLQPELKLVTAKNPPYVRDANNFQANTLGNLYLHSIVEVYSIDANGWAFIRYGDLTGYVIGHALSTPNVKTMMINDANGLTVRQTASPSGQQIGTLANGTQVDVYTTFQDWSYIVTKDMQGYVVASKLKAVTTHSNPTSKPVQVGKYNQGITKPNKRVALTFDDGPHPTVTQQVLKTLKKYDAKATFFVTGHRVKANPQILKEVFDAGHEIGNHTYKHPKLTTIPIKEVKSQITTTDAQIKAAIGQNATVFRPPYGAYNAQIQAQLSVPLIMWSVDTLDWKHRDPKKTLQSVKAQAKNGSIILMHDVHQPTADALDSVLAYLSKQGYEFVTVSEIIQ